MSAKLPTNPYKGSRDFYPEEMKIRNWVFARVRSVLESFGFEAYDGPLLESFEVYAAKTGEEIVSQQLYSFEDRGGRRVAIRPEMTPTLARMVAAKIQELPKPLRWYSIPNLWRYERPQRGRLREHWQINADLLGGNIAQSNAEILALAGALFAAFGGQDFVEIRFNSRRLMDGIFYKYFGLDPDAAVKLGKLIDAQTKMAPELYEAKVLEILKPEHLEFLKRFFTMKLPEVEHALLGLQIPDLVEAVKELKALKESYEERGVPVALIFDPSIMRGLDYYTGIVFEAFDVSPENRRALFGGGRYDNLIGLFSKAELSGVGFGLGDVTLMHFLETHNLLPKLSDEKKVYVGCVEPDLLNPAFKVESQLRAWGLSVLSGQEALALKDHLKIASKLQAGHFVGIMGNEWAQRQVIVKDLVSGDQKTLSMQSEIEAWARSLAKS